MTTSAARPSPPMAPAPEGSAMRAAPRPGPLAGIRWRSGPIDPWINPRVRIAGLARATRALNLVVPVVLAATVVASAVGEMGYVMLGSAVEVLLLGGIAWLAWTWPMRVPAEPRADAWTR